MAQGLLDGAYGGFTNDERHPAGREMSRRLMHAQAYSRPGLLEGLLPEVKPGAFVPPSVTNRAPLSPADRQMYLDAAYKTPWEPFIAGELNWRPPTQETDVSLSGGIAGRDNAGERILAHRPADPRIPMAYAEMYRDTLYSPLTAVGANDPGDVLLAPGGHNFKLGLLGGLMALGGRLLGTYDPPSGRVVANVDAGPETLSHEVLHRGFDRVRDSMPEVAVGPRAQDDHVLMRSHDTMTGSRTSVGRRAVPTEERMQLLQRYMDRAQQVYDRNQHRGGR